MVSHDWCGGSRDELLGELALELGFGTKDVNREGKQGKAVLGEQWEVGLPVQFPLSWTSAEVVL